MSIKQTVSSDQRLLQKGPNNVRGEITEKEIQFDPSEARKKLLSKSSEEKIVKIDPSIPKILSDLPVEENEHKALEILEDLLKENKETLRALKLVLNNLLNDPPKFLSLAKEEHIANLTVSLLRAEISVMSKVSNRAYPRRGLDVVRIKIAKSRHGKDGFGRIELDNPQTLMEMQDNLLGDQRTRPRNYITETVSRLIDDGESDLEILKATTKRGIIEEVLLPLSEGDSSITNEQREELAEWLVQDVSFRTQSGQDVQSGSTQVLSHYRLHTIHVDVPSPEGDSVPPSLKPLLQKFSKKGMRIKRETEGNTLVWFPISHQKIEPIRAPIYCHSQHDAKQIESMQKTRELGLRINRETDNIGLKPMDSGSLDMKDASKEDWLGIVPEKYNKDLEAAMKAHIHEDDWLDIRDQIRSMGDRRSSYHGREESKKRIGDGGLYNPVKTTISIMRAVADYGCKDCGAKKGETCEGEKSELVEDTYNFNNSNPKYTLKKYTFRIHQSRVDDYRGRPETDGSQIWRDLAINKRYQEGRLELVNYDNLELTEVKSGAKLYQITTKSQSGKITLEPVKKKQKKNGKTEEVVVEYNPKESNANSSTDGWWFQVHIDQSTDDMRKIANKLAKVGYNFVLLCCTTGNKKKINKAFGIISLLDLEILADRLDRKKKPRD